MSHKVLEVNGSVKTDERVVVSMPVTADGRGFSLLAEAINGDNQPAIMMTGALFPDQVSLAFQCGASGVLISNEDWDLRSLKSWFDAASPKVSVGYRQAPWQGVQNIADFR